MANTGAIRAGKAFVEIGGENSKLLKVLDDAEKRLTSFASFAFKAGGSLIAAGVAILVPLTAAVFEFAAIGDELDKMSARTGVATAALAELGFASEQTGASQETLEKSFTRMQKNLYDAQAGTKKAVDALANAGFTYDDLKDKSPEEQFLLLGDAIGKIKDQTIKAGVANDVFGRSGTRLIPLFNEQREGMEALRQEARELGLSVSTEQAKAAAEFTDAYNRVKRSIKGVVFSIGAELAPTLTDLSRHVIAGIKTVRQWVSENGKLIKIAAASAVGLIALGSVIVGVGAITYAAALGYKLLGAAITLVTAGMGFLTGVMQFALSPMWLIVAAVGAIIYYSGAGGEALDWLSERFGELGTYATETFGLLKKALNAGEYKLAAELLWASVQLVWYEGLQSLTGSVATWKKTFLDIWETAIDNAAGFFINKWAMLQSAWVSITQFFGDAWDLVIGGIVNAWKDAQNYIANTALEIVAKIDPEFDLKGAKESLKEMHDLEKNDRTSARNQSIIDRDQKTKAELKTIEQGRQGALSENAAESERKQKDRDQRLVDALADSQKKVNEAKAGLELAASKVKALPDDTALVKNAKKNADFGNSPAADKALGKATSGDLRTQAGLQALVDLVNNSGRDKTIEAINTTNSLVASLILAVEKSRIKTLETA